MEKLEKIASYVINNQKFEKQRLNEALNAYGRPFINYLFGEIKKLNMLQDGKHFLLIANGLLEYYAENQEMLRYVDTQLAELEEVLPKMSLEEVLKKEELAVEESIRGDIKSIKQKVQSLLGNDRYSHKKLFNSE